MTPSESLEFFAELDAIAAVEPIALSPRDLALLDELNAIGAKTDDLGRPQVVAEAASRGDQIAQADKDPHASTGSACQCADHIINTTIQTTANAGSVQHTLLTLKDDGTLISAPGAWPKSCSRSSPVTIAGHRPVHAANSANAPTREPRRKAARLDVAARTKTWGGSKSKDRKDRLTEAEKLSAAVWYAEAVRGVAVSLNLGIRREGMLLNHEDPRRRMMQNLHRQFSAAGLSHVPYAMVFEVAPGRGGGRLHLHGVIDTSGLDQGDLKRLREALCKAASRATGAIGGLRQLEMVDLHNAPGWADYLMKDATRTARELRIEDPFMMNNPMRRAARAHFENLRVSERERSEPSSGSVAESVVKSSKKRKKAA